MSMVDDIQIEMTIVLGSAQVPIRQILQMGRGATIALDAGHDDPTVIFVHGQPVAEGRVLVTDEQMAIEITDVLQRGHA